MGFIVNALPVKLIVMNLTMISNNIKFYTDQLLITLGCQRHYTIGNPIAWMEMITLCIKPFPQPRDAAQREGVLKSG